MESEGARCRCRLTPEFAFATLALCFGTALAIATPPFDSPDEWRHFSRAYLISEGRLLPTGSAPERQLSVPLDLLTVHELHGPVARSHVFLESLGAIRAPIDPVKRVPLSGKLNLYSMGLSNPVTYAGQAVALYVGRRAGLSAAALLYLGRLETLLIWTALCFLAVRTTPFRKWTFAVLCLTPMSIFLASSLSADPLTSGLSLLLLSWVLRCGFGPRGTIRRGDAAVLILLGAMIGLSKFGYWPLAFLPVLIPGHRFSSGRRRLAIVAAVAAAALVPSLLWTLRVQEMGPEPFKPYLDPTAQFHGILEAPWKYCWLLLRSVVTHAPGYLASWVGILGYLDVVLPAPVYFVYPLAILALAAAEGENPPGLSSKARLLLLGIAAIGGLLVLTLNYLVWNAVGASEITGVQGRYFIPYAPLVIAALPALAEPGWVRGWWVLAFAAGVLTITVFTVVRHYYF